MTAASAPRTESTGPGHDFGQFPAARYLHCSGKRSIKGEFWVKVDHITSTFKPWHKGDKGKHYNATLSWRTDVGASLTVSGSTTCRPSKALKAITVRLTVGPLQVKLHPDFKLAISANGRIKASQTTNNSITLAGRLNGDVPAVSHHMDPQPPEVTAAGKITFDALIGAEADITAGVVDVDLEILGGIHGATTTQSSPAGVCVRGYPEIEAVAKIGVSVFGWNWHKTFADHTWPLRSANFTLCSISPPQIVTTSLHAATLGQPYSTDLTTADHRIGTWQAAVIPPATGPALPPGLSLAGYTISGTPLAVGSYSFRLVFTDAAGKVAAAVATLHVEDPPDLTAVDLPPDVTNFEAERTRWPGPDGRVLTAWSGADGDYLGWEEADGTRPSRAMALGSGESVADAAFAPDGSAYFELATGIHDSPGYVEKIAPGSLAPQRVAAFPFTDPGNSGGPRPPYDMAIIGSHLFVREEAHNYFDCATFMTELKLDGSVVAGPVSTDNCSPGSISASAGRIILDGTRGTTFALDSTTREHDYPGPPSGQNGPTFVTGGDGVLTAIADSYTGCAQRMWIGYSATQAGAIWQFPETDIAGSGCMLASTTDSLGDGVALGSTSDGNGLNIAVVAQDGTISRTSIGSGDPVVWAKLMPDGGGKVAIIYGTAHKCTSPADGHQDSCVQVNIDLLNALTLSVSPVTHFGGTWGASYSYPFIEQPTLGYIPVDVHRRDAESMGGGEVERHVVAADVVRQTWSD